jgi:hypothetical protein
MILNKNFAGPAAKHEAHKNAVIAYLEALPADKQGVSFDDARKALSLSADALPDGHIHQLAEDAGYKVVR